MKQTNFNKNTPPPRYLTTQFQIYSWQLYIYAGYRYIVYGILYERYSFGNMKPTLMWVCIGILHTWTMEIATRDEHSRTLMCLCLSSRQLMVCRNVKKKKRASVRYNHMCLYSIHTAHTHLAENIQIMLREYTLPSRVQIESGMYAFKYIRLFAHTAHTHTHAQILIIPDCLPNPVNEKKVERIYLSVLLHSSSSSHTAQFWFN